jgi:DNA-binding transcriptional MerR regulator
VKLTDLAEQTGQPERLVRYLIAEGVVPPPVGERKAARYDERHLRAISRYLALKDAGLALKAIKAVMNGEGEMIPFPVTDGVVLQLHPRLIASGADPQLIVDMIAKVLSERLLPKNSNNPETDYARTD